MTVRTIVIASLAAIGCSSEYPPCELGGHGGAAPVPTIVVAASGPVGAASGGPYGATADHGYHIEADGHVCACSADDAERFACAEVPPQRGFPLCAPGQTEDCIGPGVEHAEPHTAGVCGPTFWCCFNIKCADDHVSARHDLPICPGLVGQPKTRDGAWAHWKEWVRLERKGLMVKHGICAVREASCYAEPLGSPKICFNYPL